ncbi:hypothetical protein D3C73_1021900 [compost metagenome]
MAEGGLGGAVGAEMALGIARRHRADVDDVAATGLTHQRHTQLAEGVAGGDVEGQHLGELLGRHRQWIVGPAAADVVDQMSDPAHLLNALTHQRLALSGIVDVTGDGQGAPAQAAHFLGHCLYFVQRTCRTHHIGTGFGICQGNRPTNAAAGAGDNGDAAVQLETLQNTHGPLLRGVDYGWVYYRFRGWIGHRLNGLAGGVHIRFFGNGDLWFRPYGELLGKAERRPAPSNQGLLPLSFGASLVLGTEWWGKRIFGYFWALSKVTRCKSGTLSRRYRSNGYTPSPKNHAHP